MTPISRAKVHPIQPLVYELDCAQHNNVYSSTRRQFYQKNIPVKKVARKMYENTNDFFTTSNVD